MGDHVSDDHPVPAPLLRDPPLPPGYTDPLEDAGILAEPFSRTAAPDAETAADPASEPDTDPDTDPDADANADRASDVDADRDTGATDARDDRGEHRDDSTGERGRDDDATR